MSTSTRAHLISEAVVASYIHDLAARGAAGSPRPAARRDRADGLGRSRTARLSASASEQRRRSERLPVAA